jgi:PAS domain S-box-containing protein
VQRTGKSLLVGSDMNARKRRVGHEVTFEGYPDLRYVESGAPAAIWLGVPLSVDGGTFGVMAVQDYHDPKAYGNKEKQVLTFIAEQTALALERKRVEQALRESEEKYRALFAASSQGVMLHDEHQYLEVNPAAVRILGYSCQEELLGKNPGDTSPPLQPNGESSESLATKHIAECMSRGSARFEWVSRTSQGQDIPLEVALTRI